MTHTILFAMVLLGGTASFANADFHDSSIVARCEFGEPGQTQCQALLRFFNLKPKNGGVTTGRESDYLIVTCENSRSSTQEEVVYDGGAECTLKPGSDGSEEIVDTIFIGIASGKVEAVVNFWDFNWTKQLGKYQAQIATQGMTLDGVCRSY